MPSPTEVINHALDMVNASPIQNIDNPDAKTQRCKRIYDFCLPIIMGKDQWNFSEQKVSIAADPDAPLNEWDYSYQMPATCIRPNRINNDDTIEWEQEGRKILTDAEAPIILEFFGLPTDPNLWDTAFLETFTAYLASRYAKAFPQDNDKSGREFAEYEHTLGEAQAKNSQTGTPARPNVGALTTDIRRY